MTTITRNTTMQVGDILQSDWGVDMRIICYYEVLAVSPSGKTVTVRELKKRARPMDFMTGDEHVEPVLAGDDRFTPGSKPLRRRVNNHGGEPHIVINDYEHAYPISGVDLLAGAVQNTWD